MSEPEVEDFAAMFEASVKTRRFTRGQSIEGTIVEAWSEHFPGRGDHLCINLLGAAGERYTFAIPMPLASGERLLPERVLGQRFAIEYGTDGGGSTPSMLPFAVEPDADN